MTRSRLIFNSLFLLACFYVFAYPSMRLSTWFGPQYAIGWGGGCVLWLLGFIGMRYSFGGPRMRVRYVVVHWMGISFILASVALVYEVLRIFLPYPDAAVAPWLLMTGGLLVIGTIIASHHLRVKKIRIASPKIPANIRVVQISDVHIGSRQRGFMTRIVDRINKLQPDFVVITGDLLDSSSVDIDALEPLRMLSATTYFSVGNHERYADLDKAIGMLEEVGVKPLQQAKVAHEVLQFIGIDDAESPGQVAKHLPGLQPSAQHFSILLYHRPLGFETAASHGIDLMLSGHTHNGQIFPFNFLVRRHFKRIQGLYRSEIGTHIAHHYVSPGTGTWGPLMRLGSLNEISCFDLVPANVAGTTE